MTLALETLPSLLEPVAPLVQKYLIRQQDQLLQLKMREDEFFIHVIEVFNLLPSF